MKEIKKNFARTLRKEQTVFENKAWLLLRGRKMQGFKFRRQHVIEGFIVDFYCHEFRLAIEIDGSIHEKRKEYDELRQIVLESKSIKVLRFKNEQLHRDPLILQKQIAKIIKSIIIPLPPGEENKD